MKALINSDWLLPDRYKDLDPLVLNLILNDGTYINSYGAAGKKDTERLLSSLYKFSVDMIGNLLQKQSSAVVNYLQYERWQDCKDLSSPLAFGIGVALNHYKTFNYRINPGHVTWESKQVDFEDPAAPYWPEMTRYALNQNTMNYDLIKYFLDHDYISTRWDLTRAMILTGDKIDTIADKIVSFSSSSGSKLELWSELMNLMTNHNKKLDLKLATRLSKKVTLITLRSELLNAKEHALAKTLQKQCYDRMVELGVIDGG